ncbi:MAG: type II secretion system protein [Chthoniobacteraceae bacterium]
MRCAILCLGLLAELASAGPFPGAPGTAGSTAIAHNDPRIVAWGSAVGAVSRGRIDIENPDSPFASYGEPTDALGPANSFDPEIGVVSLGDRGSITITFAQPIANGPGFDFAVFENGFDDRFLELAFVEVAGLDGIFVRFPSISLTQTAQQVDMFDPGYTGIDPTDLDGLAGKYRAMWGTPFDLAVVGLSIVTAVRVVDVVGSIDPLYASYDTSVPARIINDPFPTPFSSGGFDLDAIAVLHQVPEPGAAALFAMGALLLFRRPGRMSRSAFTLVELLVVVAIIAVLAGLSLVVAGSARARADSAKCVSNLRQLAAAALAYAGENGGQYVPSQEPGNRIRWHGARGGSTGAFDGTKGPLSPYLGLSRRVKLCPALQRVLTGSASFEEGTGGYGYNAAYIGGTPADPFKPERLGNVPAPSRVVMFADCAFPRKGGVQEYAYAEPWRWPDYSGKLRGALAPSVHFRHDGTANVVWCDGHISAEKPSKLGGKNGYGGDAQKWTIGWFGPEDQNGWWNPQRVAP